MSFESNNRWYQQIAQTARNLVDENDDGMFAVKLDELRRVFAELDADMEGCPELLFEHFTCALRRRGLTSCGSELYSGETLIIYDREKHGSAKWVRERWIATGRRVLQPSKEAVSA